MNTTNLHHRLVRTFVVSAVLIGTLSPATFAGELEPGSLLLFPEFESGDGHQYLITVTNMHPTQSVKTLWNYVDGEDCTEFDRTEDLTPNDTITVLSSFHNPEQDRGFLYVSAMDPKLFQAPIAFNWLIGTATRIDGFEAFDYTVDPFPFRGVAAELQLTDVNGDGLQDFDGNEYSTVPDLLLVPRFLGQNSDRQSELVLLNLTGSVQFDATVDLLIYNDNEEVFSTSHEFRCWTKVPLLDVSGVFDEDFLRDFTGHDLDEVLGAPIVESGWFRIMGNRAESSAQSIDDPAILGFLVERTSNAGQGAELPFGIGAQSNGALLDFGIFTGRAVKPDNPALTPQR